MERREPPSAPGRRALRWSILVALIALSLAAHRENLSYGILGLDSYMQISAARVESWADFTGTFTERLTDGRIGPEFYRPWQNLSIAFDYAAWGLEARGYQLQTLVVWAATIAMLFLASSRLLGATIGPGIAAAAFALHPNLLNVLPAPCRRSELWVVFFLLATLWVLPYGRDDRRHTRIGLAALFVLLAAASKETGAMGAGLVLVHQFFFSPRAGREDSIAQRARAALAAATPAVLGTVLFLAARTAVLGGLGGYPPTKGDAGFATNLATNLGSLSVDLFLPSGAVEARSAQVIGIVAACLFIAAAAVAARAGSRRHRAGVLLGFAWALPPLALLGTRDWYGPWYATIPLAGGCFALAAIVEFLIAEQGRASVWLMRAATGVVTAVALVASPLWIDYPEWRAASEDLRTALSELDEQMPAAALGDVVVVASRPYYHGPKRDIPRLRWVAMIADRGLQAYAEMKWPDKNPKARFVHGPRGLEKSRPGSVTIAVPFVSFDP